MSPAVGTPTICVAHGDASAVLSRIGWVAAANGWQAFLSPAPAFDIESAKAIIGSVGQGEPLLVFHLMKTGDGAEPDTQALCDERDRIDSLILQEYPTLDLRSWAIVSTGHILEPREIEALSALRPGSRGVIATAAATSTSVDHPHDDEVAFAANIVSVLGTSTLEGELGQMGTIWLGSASSATFSRRSLELAVGARTIRAHLSDLLADINVDESSTIGSFFLGDLDLGGDDEIRGLLTSGAGGSLLARVRFGVLDFGQIPVEAWSDVILGHHDMVVMHDMPLIKERILQNTSARLADLKDRIRRKLIDDFEETGNVAASIAFCEGMHRSLRRAIENLGDAPRDEHAYDTAEDRRKLRQLTRWLPYGPAVAVRLLASALLALVVTAFVTGGAQVPVNFTTSSWPVGAAATLLLVGGTLYWRRYRRTVRVRNRLTQGIEDRLVNDVLEVAFKARAGMLEELRAWVGTQVSEPSEPETEIPQHADTVSDWFVHLRTLLHSIEDEVRERDEQRVSRKIGPTEYAINIPTPNAAPTAKLDIDGAEPTHDEVVRGLVHAIRADLLDDALPVPSLDTLVDDWTDSLQIGIALKWNSLEDLLDADDATLSEVRSLLAADLTPAGGTSPRVLHYLVAPGGADGKSASAITPSPGKPAPQVMTSLTAIKSTTAPNFVAMLHLYQLEHDATEEQL